MRTPAPRWLALALLALCACSGDDNYVLSGYGPVIISPVRSALAAQMNFTDQSNVQHQQWVIALTDASDVCTKLATHPDYFQNPIEVFDAAIVWVPPGNLGSFTVGQQNTTGSTVGDEILVGRALTDGGSPQRTRLTEVVGVGGNITLTQFNVGPGGQAIGTFDVAVFDPTGVPREFVGKFKTSYCTAMETALLP
jgi:hypothetical protein